MGQLRQRGEVWWIRYSRNGRRFEKNARSRKKVDAEWLLKLCEGEIVPGSRPSNVVKRLRCRIKVFSSSKRPFRPLKGSPVGSWLETLKETCVVRWMNSARRLRQKREWNLPSIAYYRVYEGCMPPVSPGVAATFSATRPPSTAFLRPLSRSCYQS